MTTVDAAFQPPTEIADVPLRRATSPSTTTFELCEEAADRRLRLLARATNIEAESVPAAWRSAEIVHLAPICNELHAPILDCLGSRFVGATIQGWLRGADPTGLIRPSLDALSGLPLERLSAIVVSSADLELGTATCGMVGVLDELRARVPVVALTRGADGSTVYSGGGVHEIPALAAQAVDTVGAGDVYAAAFFIHLGDGDDPVASAQFAACAAGLAVEGAGWSRIPDRDEVDRVMRSARWAR